jgi:exodeoxyribonuclease VII large subunit
MQEKLTLSELQQAIRDSLYIALPDFYWVVAEISELKENQNGHCYLELVERQADDINVRARIKAVIWGNRFRFLKSFFEDAAGQQLSQGMKILVKAKIDYHELYGLSLVITDIDPAYTVGELAMKRQLIISRLEKEGVLTMNKELEFPVFPLRIAVISSLGAAGYTDFITHLTGNIRKYVFHTILFEAYMQGAETEQSIISALDNIADKPDHFDIVVIIRGGGSQTDLSWFDNYNIAYHITQFPLPVLTGIGHQKDMSVADIVAYKALKTPTAVADFIIECVTRSEEYLNEMASEIYEITRSLLDNKLNLIRELKLRIAAESSKVVAAANLNLRRLESDLRNDSTNMVERRKSTLTNLHRSLMILDPVNVLKRGYSVTTLNGRTVKNRAELKKDDIIDTRLFDGYVRSKVIK